MFGLSPWKLTLAMILAVTVARVLFQMYLTPWELLGDEAYYWMQARHLDVNYAEKGPLLAWMIALSTAMFGHVEWAVRLPAVLSISGTGLALGMLTRDLVRGQFGGDQYKQDLAAMMAVIFFFLLPANIANAQICTQDSPMTLLWVLLSWVSLKIFRIWRQEGTTKNAWALWITFWILMGIGVLLKQSIFMFLGGMGVYWLLHMRALPLKPVWVLQQLLGVGILAVMCSPMIWWDSQHDWLMLGHTLGHLGAGGDQAGKVHKGFWLLWVGNTIGSFVGVFGPAGVVLMIWAWVASWKRAGELKSTESSSSDALAIKGLREDAQWLMISAWFATAFFILLSFRKPIVPSWPLPNMAPACAVVGWFLVAARDSLSTGSAAQRRFARWRMTAWVYGGAAVLLLSFPTILRYVPVYGSKIQEKVLAQLSSSRENARKVEEELQRWQAENPQRQFPIVIMRHYQTASLMSFYLPGHPAVSTSGRYIDKRPSNFDHWPDTSLENPAHYGRDLILASENGFRWGDVLMCDEVTHLPESNLFKARNYRGIQPAYLAQSARR